MLMYSPLSICLQTTHLKQPRCHWLPRATKACPFLMRRRQPLQSGGAKAPAAQLPRPLSKAPPPKDAKSHLPLAYLMPAGGGVKGLAQRWQMRSFPLKVTQSPAGKGRLRNEAKAHPLTLVAFACACAYAALDFGGSPFTHLTCGHSEAVGGRVQTPAPAAMFVSDSYLQTVQTKQVG